MDAQDDLTKVHLDLPNHWRAKGESLWAKHLGSDLYEIHNVPFCAYDLNCGDVVHAVSGTPDLKPEIQSVVRRSGNRTLRVNFDIPKEEQGPHLEVIEAKGAWIERANSHFICINIPQSAAYTAICDYLWEQEAGGALVYETCEARVPGSFDDSPKNHESADDA